jgi:hypothetical protein
VSPRLLAVITPGDEAAALAGFAGLMSIARAAGAEVRVAYVHDLPEPRVDRHDRIVADTDTEMARIEATATHTVVTAARVFDDVPVETVVRFGAPRREAVLEAEVYAPQIVVVFSAVAGRLNRFRAWALRRRLARQPDARLLLMEAPRATATTPIATPRTATPGAERPSVGRAV